jgi:hypothetical protein
MEIIHRIEDRHGAKSAPRDDIKIKNPPPVWVKDDEATRGFVELSEIPRKR